MTKRYVDDGDGHTDEIDDVGAGSLRQPVVIDIDAASGRAFITTSSLARLMDEIEELRGARDLLLKQIQDDERARRNDAQPSVQALLGEAHAILNDLPADGHRAESVNAWLAKVRAR